MNTNVLPVRMQELLAEPLCEVLREARWVVTHAPGRVLPQGAVWVVPHRRQRGRSVPDVYLSGVLRCEGLPLVWFAIMIY